MAPPIPRLKGRGRTLAPRSAAIPAVRSVEPSSTTTMSNPRSNARISSMTRPIDASSFSEGTIAIRLSSPSWARISPEGGTGTSANSAMCGHRRGGADQIENLPGAMGIGVFVKDAFAGAPAHRLRGGRIVDQLPVCTDSLVGCRHDTQLRAGLEPALDPLLRVGDDRRSGGGQLERTTGRRRVDGRVGSARDVEVDPAARDRLREDVEGDVADHPRVPDVAAKVPAAEREVHLGLAPAGLTDERLHPLPAELVPVAVEEDVVLLLDRCRLEQLG